MSRGLIYMAAAACVAWSADGASGAACPPPVVSVAILDEARSPGTVLSSPDAVQDRHLRAFVSAVTEGLSTRLAAAGFCPETAAGGAVQATLRFVRHPLVASGAGRVFFEPSLDADVPADGCRIRSPWLDLAVDRGATPAVRAVVFWSERQFLLDQALLAGSAVTPPARPLPLVPDEFDRLADIYAEEEILRMPEAPAPVLEDRIPPDILWLFRRAWQSTRGPFSEAAADAMPAALDAGARGYADLVLALFDVCLSAGGSRDFRTILDVSSETSFEPHRIEKIER